MAEKNKSGAGKFFLGAALGAAVGAIASKFIKVDVTEEPVSDDLDSDDKCCCGEGAECCCDKDEECCKKSDESQEQPESKSTKAKSESTTEKKPKEK